MKGIHRALIGALIGTILTLAVHPKTSPFYRTVFQAGTTTTINQIDSVMSWNGKPRTELDYFYAAEIYAERTRQGRLSREGLRAAAKLFLKARVAYPKNAFWDQMLASVYLRGAQRDRAYASWRAASQKDQWNSGQSQLALARVDRIRNALGYELSWIYARAYLLRSIAPGYEVERTARALLTNTSMRDEPGISIRYQSALNGMLMREHGKLIEEGKVGSEVIRLAAYPSALLDTARPKQLYLGQILLADSLRLARRTADADRIQTVFQSAESWTGMATRRSIPEQTSLRVTGSLLTSTLGGFGPILLMFGLIAFLLEKLVAERLVATRTFPVFATGVGSVVAGSIIGYLSQYPLGGILAATVGLSFAWQPKAVRKVSPNDLGPLFNLTVRILLLSLCAAGYLSSVWNSLPFRTVTSQISGPWDGVDGVAWLRVATLVSYLLMLCVPTWAFAQRLSAPAVVRCLINRARTTLVWIGVFLMISSAPIGIFLDRQNQDAWKRIISNEPFYYLR
jgi:hypothetical protein